jgi:GGDEF domain-containing protein
VNLATRAAASPTQQPVPVPPTFLPDPTTPSADTTTPAVLLVTACPWTARAVDASLAGVGLATVRVADADGAVGLCAANRVDAVVIDERAAPGATSRGAATCSRLIHAAGVPELPIMVLIREPVDGRTQAELYAAGAWGLAHYPLGTTAWIHQLAGWVRATRSARRRLDDGLLDQTTGLYNARGLEQRAHEIDAAARRTGGALACAVFSIGAPTAWAPIGWFADAPADDGTTAVQRVADACRRVGRASDVFGRLGPTAFGVIAPGADGEGARTLVARIGDALGESAPRHGDLRVGICAVPETRTAGLSVADMLAHAASRA